MSARRVLLFVWSCSLLLVLLPKQISNVQAIPSRLPTATAIQVDTFVGTWLMDRFHGDVFILPYIDAYGSLLDITYTERGRGIGLVKPVVPIKSPIGFCIILDKLRRGKYIPAEVKGWYDKSEKPFQYMTTDMLKLFNEVELNSMCEYWLANTVTRKEPATVDSLRYRIKEFKGAIILMHGYYPIYLYDYDGSSFYAYDPFLRSDVQNIIIEKDNKLVYRNGFLTYIGGDMLCSD